jgi:hypothetical protein
VSDKTCPKCGEECNQDEVDVGVGIIYGPLGCYSCGWSDNPEYDSSEGSSPASKKNPDFYVDACGGMVRHSKIADRLSHFGLNGDEIIDEVFKDHED